MPRKKMTEEEKAKRKIKKEYEKAVNTYKHEIENSLDDVQRYDFIPEPVYQFKVGDRIVYGAYDWTKVLEVCEGGKYYKLFSVTRHTKRNIPDHTSFKIHYEAWFRLNFYREDWSDTEMFQEDDDIFFSYQQRDMSSLLYMMHKQYGIDLEPEYQRGNVWDDKRKWNLIDSVFKNIDIGKFTIIRRPWGKNPNKPATPKLYEMLDGKQRITALFEFYTGKFKYRGKYFYELCPADRSHFKRYKISYAECEPLTDEQKYRYFLKLNTTGIPVDENHIEKVKDLWEKSKNDKNKTKSKKFKA